MAHLNIDNILTIYTQRQCLSTIDLSCKVKFNTYDTIAVYAGAVKIVRVGGTKYSGI